MDRADQRLVGSGRDSRLARRFRFHGLTPGEISLADNLHITVVAEGVETEAQRAYLHDHGCRHYQGYLFSEALPLEAFEARLRRVATS